MGNRLSNLIIISNRSARSMRNGVVEAFREKLEEDRKGKFKHEEVFAKTFPSGEVYVQLPENVRRKHIHLIAGFYREDLYFLRRQVANSNMPIGEKAKILEQYMHSVESDIRECEKICDAARRSGCEEINIYFLSMPDSRQDKKDESRVSISVKLNIDDFVHSAEPELARMGLIDIHSMQTQGHTNYPVDHITAKPILLMYIRKELRDLKNVNLIAPDEGAAKRTKKTAQELGIQYTIHNKIRSGHSISQKGELIGDDVKGRNCVIIDDIIDGGGTVISAADTLKESGAVNIYALCTHGIFSTRIIRDKEQNPTDIIFAEDLLRKSGIMVITTDTVQRSKEYYQEHSDWLLPPLTVAPMIADLIYCNEKGKSHGDLIRKYMRSALDGNVTELNKYLLRV